MSELDESWHLFNSAELAIARRLCAEGASVRAVSASGLTHSPDAEVDGVPTEFKRVHTGHAHTLKHALNRAKKQAQHVVVDAGGTSMTVESALHGIRRFVGSGSTRLRTVRIYLSEASISIEGMNGTAPIKVVVDLDGHSTPIETTL